MSLTLMDRLIMSTTHLPFAVRQCVYAVNNATSHAAVSQALVRLRWYLVVTMPVSAIVQHLDRVPWKPAIARYDVVLCSVVATFSTVLCVGHSSSDIHHRSVGP